MDVQAFYNHAQDFYDRKFKDVKGIQKAVHHGIDVLAIPFLFVAVDFLLNNTNYSLEQKLTYFVIPVILIVAVIIAIYPLTDILKICIEMKNMKYERLLNALKVISTLDLKMIEDLPMPEATAHLNHQENT